MSRFQKIGPVVVVSIVSGLLVAIILSLFVFAGAVEPVITGSLLLGFAFGWFLLAFLSTKYTDQPQKWAYIPAAYMGVVGILLIILKPSSNLIAMSGWVWPIVLITLTVWMFMQVMRNVHSRAKYWMLYPVLVVLLLSAVGGAFERVQESINKNRYPLQGKLVDVGDYSMRIECKGSGSPTVVMEAGLGEPVSMQAGWIMPAVAQQTRVCIYDRQGRGWSEESPKPLDGKQSVADLYTLLNRSHINGPIVLAGHSSGGLYVLNYAHEYPREVAGVVLLDSMSPYQYEKLPAWPAFYASFSKVSAVLPTMARIGVGRLVYGSVAPELPTDVRGQTRAFWGSPAMQRSQRDEFATIRATLNQAKQLTTLGDKPLYVVTAQVGTQKGWQAVQDQLATLSSNSIHKNVAGASHGTLITNQQYAAASSGAILDVVNATRNNELLKN